MKVVIDAEFKAYMSHLTADELSQLEANLKCDGCRDPLAVWRYNNEAILLDGHSRLEICERLGIEYEVVEVHVEDRNDALDWIVQNQLGRRNLESILRIELVRKLESRFKQEAKERQETTQLSGKNEDGSPAFGSGNIATTDVGKSRDHLGALAGVSGRTYEKGVFVLEHADEETKVRRRCETGGTILPILKRFSACKGWPGL